MNFESQKWRLWNFWPPFFFTGIKIVKVSVDYRHIAVRLKLRFWNANYVGTQYGGAMFSMADPFYMLMLIKNLGSEYTVWDKSAQIRYLKPGRSDLTAEFHLSEEDLTSIRKTVQEQGRMDWVRKVILKDTHGEEIAEVEKVINIKMRK